MSSRISIIIPTYNEANYIVGCLGSILNQDIDCEIIVVDDGSTDNTVEICQPYVDKLLVLKHTGNLGLLRNRGAELATLEYIMFMDADLRLAPKVLKQFVDVLSQTDDDVAFIYGDFVIKDDLHMISYQPFSDILKANFIPITTVIKHSAFKRVKGFSEDLKRFVDWDLWLKFLKYGYTAISMNTILFYSVRKIKPMTPKQLDECYNAIRKRYPELFNKEVV